MIENQTWIPLFPLKTVLFPDGLLPLKVFETKYIGMVRDCMQNNMPFGVVLTKTAQETGNASEAEQVGCLAYIEHCDMPDTGTMMLRTRGGDRFRILETRILADQRTEARIEMIPVDASVPVSAIHVSCAKALKIVMDNLTAKGRAERGAGFEGPFTTPLQFDNAAWVANRWCEILPIPLKARQKLLELDNAQSRLSVVHQYLQQHKIV